MNWSQLVNAKRGRELEGGRPSSPTSPAEARNEAERDFDRAVFCSSLRRLQDKAQVWPLERNDFVRTRLTHSLEVSTVARGMARRVGTWLIERKEIDDDQSRAIEAICATCGLLHDLGNPPFGHSGEEAMREWFLRHLDEEGLNAALGGEKSQMAKDLTLFDGNPQTIRLVTHLQMLADHSGLNLTAGTLSCLLKYTARSNETDNTKHETKKPGFFTSEGDLVELVRSETGTGASRNPLTYLVEAADDIVYSTVDIEDGLRKGVLDWGDLRRLFSECAASGDVHEVLDEAEHYIKAAPASLTGKARDEALVQIWRTYVIGRHVAAADKAFRNHYEEIMEGSFHHELLRVGDTQDLLKACKDIGGKHIYRHHSILALEIMGRNVIQELMRMFWEGVSEATEEEQFSDVFHGKIYALMSSNYREVFKASMKDGQDPTFAKLQLVADWVSGMTDSYATALYRELTTG